MSDSIVAVIVFRSSRSDRKQSIESWHARAGGGGRDGPGKVLGRALLKLWVRSPFAPIRLRSFRASGLWLRLPTPHAFFAAAFVSNSTTFVPMLSTPMSTFSTLMSTFAPLAAFFTPFDSFKEPFKGILGPLKTSAGPFESKKRLSRARKAFREGSG